MTLRVVVLRDVEGIMHVVPNGEIKVVSNKTRGWSRAVVDVGVAYDENVDRALDVLRDEAAQFSTDKTWGAQLDGPVEVLGVESLSDSAVVLRTLIRTQPGSQWAVAREFRRRIKNRFDRESLEIPFPQRRVHVRVAGRARHRSESLTPPPGPPADDASASTTPSPAASSPFVPLAAGAGVALHLRAHDLQLRPHRELPDVPLRGPAAPLARGQRLRGVPHHEPDRRGRPDHRRRPREGRLPPRARAIRSPRAFEEDRDWLRIKPAHRAAAGHGVHRADDRADPGAAGPGRGLPGRGRLGLLRHRAVSGVRPAVAARPARAPRRRQRAGERRRVQQGGRARLRAVEGGASPRTRRSGPPGMRRSAAGGRAGTSSARRWRSSSSAGAWAPTCSTSTPAAWT